ncbi:MAG: TolB family protein, partial [Thermaurantiacus tibetensis]
MLHIRRPVALLAALLLAGPAIARDLPPPPALRLDGVPQVPAALAERVRPWMEFRTASFQGWDPATRGMLITTRFGDSNQLHLVAGPGAARRQLSFEPEPVAGGSFAPGTAGGDVLLAAADVGGAENFQLFRLAEGRMQLLTDGKSRNTGATWSKDGRLVGFASNARNGRDTDLWVVDPRDPASRRLVAERQGGGWAFLDFFPGGRSALVAR